MDGPPGLNIVAIHGPPSPCRGWSLVISEYLGWQVGQEVYGVSLRLGFQGELNKMSLLSAPGSVFIKTTLMKSPAEALRCFSDHVLVKTSKDNSRWQTERCSDDRSSRAYTLLKWFNTTNNTPWGKEATCMASAFLGKYASITAVDLIQQKKLDFWNFYESNLTEARFEII